MQRLLDERKNWALLTPEEILGLPTPEKILGQPKNEAVVVRYYERQEQLRTRTNNDSYGPADSTPWWDFSGDQEPQMDAGVWPSTGGRQGNAALTGRLLGGTPGNRAGTAQPPESGWSKSFNLPAVPPKPTPEQQAAMNQFQQLLQPHSLPGGGANSQSLGSPIFPPASTAPAPEPPAVISLGASYAPLSSRIVMPTGVTPLPGLLGPTNTGLPALAPEWKPQAPPWMSSAPQPDAIPQRKF
jgi:hypothetical protein